MCFQDWCQQRQLLMLVIALNVSLATMFFNLLSQWPTWHLDHWLLDVLVTHTRHSRPGQPPSGRFGIKVSSYHYGGFHCGGKVIVTSPFLYNGNSHTEKTGSFYWVRLICGTRWSNRRAGTFREFAAGVVSWQRWRVGSTPREKTADILCGRPHPQPRQKQGKSNFHPIWQDFFEIRGRSGWFARFMVLRT